MSQPAPFDSPLTTFSSPSSAPNLLIRTGGGLGIAGTAIGLAIFLTACAGFDAVFNFSLIPLAMGVVGLSLLLIGAARRGSGIDTSQMLAGFFVNGMAILGGLLEMAVWLRWPLFFGQAG